MKYRISRNKIQQKIILKILKIQKNWFILKYNSNNKQKNVTTLRLLTVLFSCISPVTPVCVRWFFHHEGFNVSCDKMGTNSIPLMFSCSSSLNLSLSPSLVVTHALGMRASPSFRWHQRAWNSCSSSSSIKASSHGILLWGLQPRQLLPAEEGSETGRGGP